MTPDASGYGPRAGLFERISAPRRRGQRRYFRDQAFHCQTLRALNNIRADGADTAEALTTIGQIREGDVQGWYGAWTATAERVLERASRTGDARSRGQAQLRAHNTLRTAEFFLPPADPKRPTASVRNVEAFEVAAAHERGFAVLTFEGPGQGAVLREQQLAFTPEREYPTAAVLDAHFARALTPARSVQLIVCGAASGGADHCQMGAQSLGHADLFDWIARIGHVPDLGRAGSCAAAPMASPPSDGNEFHPSRKTDEDKHL